MIVACLRRLLREDLVGVLSDHVLLVGSDDDDLDTAVGSTDHHALAPDGLSIEGLIELDPHEL